MFSSTEEEVSYLRQQNEELQRRIKEMQESFDEYQQGSHDLEKELDKEIQQKETKIKDLVLRLEKAGVEVVELRVPTLFKCSKGLDVILFFQAKTPRQ